MGFVELGKEIQYICQGHYTDPARFDLALIYPLELNQTWKFGISEITIPSCIKYLSKDDFIEVQQPRPIRIKRRKKEMPRYSPFQI